MLHMWDAGEADFIRDYGIRLVERIDTMTWRQFLVLLHNLSPGGAVAVRVRAENDKRQDAPADDQEAANDFFVSMLSL